MTVLLHARDYAAEEDTWRRVRIIVEGVDECRFTEAPRTNSQVISDGLHVMATDAGVGLDVGGLPDAPTSLAELRESHMYVVGRSVRSEILEDNSDETDVAASAATRKVTAR